MGGLVTGELLINLTFPGFTLNLLWSIPIALTAHLIIIVTGYAVRDVRIWIMTKGRMRREAIGLLYLFLLLSGLYILIDITVSIFDPVVLYQSIAILGLLILRSLIKGLNRPGR